MRIKPHTFNSVKYKILFVNLILMISFNLLIIYFWNYRTSEDTRESAGNYINDMLRVSGNNLEVALKDIYALVSITSTESDIVAILSKREESTGLSYLQENRKIDDYLVNLFTYKHYLNDIMIANLNGRTFSNGNTISWEFLTKQSWYPRLINDEGASVFIPPHYNSDNPYITPYRDDRVASIARPIKYQDSVIGFVIADIKSDLLRDMFASNLNKVNILIADRSSNEIVYNSQKEKMPDPDISAMIGGMQGNEGSFYSQIDHEDNLIVYRYSPTTNWMLIGIVPKKILLEEFSKTRNSSLLLSIAFCLIALLVSTVASSYLTRPILRLNRAIKQIDGNHLDVQLEIDSNDEIGQLSRQFNSMVHRIKDLIQDTKQREQDKRKAEMRALQAQINPHFLYNTLNTIKYLSIYQGADNIHDVAESLSRLMHINMQDKVFITIEEEIEYLKSYLNIQEYKYSNKFTYSFSISESVKPYLIPKLLLQPFIENCLIHGIGPKKDMGAILIKGYAEGKKLVFKIQDNGAGIGENTIEDIVANGNSAGHVGIRNVISRIKTNFGDDYGVSIVSERNLYTIVEVTLPVITNEEMERYV